MSEKRPVWRVLTLPESIFLKLKDLRGILFSKVPRVNFPAKIFKDKIQRYKIKMNVSLKCIHYWDTLLSTGRMGLSFTGRKTGIICKDFVF